MVADNFTVMAFLIGTGVVVAGLGIAQTDWQHRFLVGGLISIGLLLIIVGAGWPWLKDGLPAITNQIANVAARPVAWALIFAILGTGHLILRSRYLASSNETPKPVASNKIEQPKTSEVQPQVAKTHPHDIPKKLVVIDEQIMPLVRDDGEIEMHLRRGRQLLNDWRRGVSQDRTKYLEELSNFQTASGAIFDRLYKIQQANPHFDDIAALLDIGNAPYAINNTYAHGLADFAAGIRSFGDPPYNNINHQYFMDKGRNQMFSSGLANYGSWLQGTRKAVTELRKKIASGEA